jgi:glycosyltransferase involved in cell wall biosynthesis
VRALSPRTAVRNVVERRRRAAKDRAIPRNIRRFQRRTDRAAVESYARPADWHDRIEVVIPCFNHGPFLRDALQSVLWQAWRPNLTVTFIDDASTDDSLAVMDDLAGQQRNGVAIRVLANERNLNQAGALNRAMGSSSSALFVVLNADDLLMPQCLEVIRDVYERYVELAMLGGSAIPFAGDSPQEIGPVASTSAPPPRIFGPADALRFTSLNSLSMTQSSCSFFRGAWELVGGYIADRRRRVCSYDDRDFQMRVSAVLPVGVLENYPMALYRTSSSQGMGAV